jgi:hypothetical protein
MGMIDLTTRMYVDEPKGAPLTGLAYLQSIYRNPAEPTPLRVRCAMAALPFENPRFGIVAHVDNLFGDRMEKALARSSMRQVIEAKPVTPVEAKPGWRRL